MERIVSVIAEVWYSSNLLDVVVRAELDVVVRIDGNKVGEDVLARKREVLDNEIHLLVGVIDARDRYIANLLDETGDNLVADIAPKLGLELELAVAIEQKVLRQLGEVVSKSIRVTVNKRKGGEQKGTYSLFNGSAAHAPNQSWTLLKRLSKCGLYLSS